MIIEKKFKNYKFDKNNLWLIKPTNKNSGEGIIIFTSLKEIKLDKYIINKYLTNLDLIDNRKYDLRIYAIIIGVNPLRLYIYKNGFVRRCTKEYSLDINSINDKNIHLTNTHINIAKKEYIHPKHPEDENATIWSLITYKKYLKKKNVDVELLDEKIKDIIIKTIISFYSKILNEIEKNNIKNLNFFDLLGFDILLTNNYEPKLLEVNTTPSPFFYNDLMKIIKTNLFIDELNLIGVVPFYHGQNLKMLNQKFDFKNYIDFRINEAICEINRPKGDFDLIFPLKQNIEKYKKFFPHLTKINIKFWEKILQN